MCAQAKCTSRLHVLHAIELFLVNLEGIDFKQIVQKYLSEGEDEEVVSFFFFAGVFFSVVVVLIWPVLVSFWAICTIVFPHWPSFYRHVYARLKPVLHAHCPVPPHAGQHFHRSFLRPEYPSPKKFARLL